MWLFDPDRSVFVLDPAFSALPNLDLAPEQRRLAAGVTNCGCGGACRYGDVYAVEGGRPVRVLRYEQECVAAGDETVVRYREYERSRGSLRVVFGTYASGAPGTAPVERDPLALVDYRDHGL